MLSQNSWRHYLILESLPNIFWPVFIKYFKTLLNADNLFLNVVLLMGFMSKISSVSFIYSFLTHTNIANQMVFITLGSHQPTDYHKCRSFKQHRFIVLEFWRSVVQSPSEWAEFMVPARLCSFWKL